MPSSSAQTLLGERSSDFVTRVPRQVEAAALARAELVKAASPHCLARWEAMMAHAAALEADNERLRIDLAKATACLDETEGRLTVAGNATQVAAAAAAEQQALAAAEADRARVAGSTASSDL